MHLTLAIRRWAFRGASPIPASAGPSTRVMFVCHGNIIRSALAEALLRQHFARAGATAVVCSAGVAATPGRPADPRAVAVARRFGVDLSEHRASLLSTALVDESDLIFIMDRLNEAEVLARFPAARGKLRRLGSLAADATDGDVIPDPFSLGADAVGAAAARIDAAVHVLTASMLGDQPSRPR
jgi:protein-tyrosine phosphatase